MSDGATEMEREERVSRNRIDWGKLDDEAHVWGTSLKSVVKDLRDREIVGIRKYGKSLTYKTDDDMLQHLYEELLDGAMYIKTLIEQRKRGKV